MSFHLLANELVFLILAYIPPSDIEAFTLIDTRCHALSLLALTAHLKHKHNAAAMHARFPHNPGSTSNGRDIMVANHLLEQGMLPNLEYLHLNGDLHWLRAQTPEIAAEHDRWPRGRAASPETVQKLMADAERFGLTLPTGFATLIGSQELIERLHLGGDTIALSKLLKCTPEQDGGKGGYVVRFLCDQQGCGFWGVYIDTAGHSCVVRAEGWRDFVCGCCKAEYVYQRVPHETIVEADANLRFVCVDAEWEGWMAGMYFDGWVGEMLWAGREVVGWEMEYVQHFEKPAQPRGQPS